MDFFLIRPKAIDQETFERIVRDFKRTLPRIARMGVQLAGPNGLGPPHVGKQAIRFNGAKKVHRAAQAFILERTLEPESSTAVEVSLNGFEGYGVPCVTLNKPYDLAVRVCLIIAKHHLGSTVKVKGGCTLPHWKKAITICKRVLGYGDGFAPDVNRHGILPPLAG